MKRIYVFLPLILFLFSLNSTVHAQLNLDMGLKVGVTRAQMDVSDLDENTTVEQLQGYMGGVFLRLTLLNLIAVQPEINYMQKGAIFKEPNIATNTFMLNYVEVPILGKLNLFKLLGIAQTSIYGGIAYSKLLEAKGRYETEDETTEQDLKELFNERENSYVGGLDIQLNLGALKLLVDGRVTLSQSNILDQEMDSEALNRVYSLSVGFLF